MKNAQNMKNEWIKSVLLVALSVIFSGAAQAVSINPDAGGGDPTISVGSLDWAAGNVLVTSVEGSVTDPEVGDVFQTFAHARLSAFIDTGGNPIGGLQLNGPTAATNYEWTYVTAFRETVFAVTGVPGAGTATFDVVAGGANFFEIYFDATPDATNVNGTGFEDGVLILSGTILPFDSTTLNGRTSFTATGISTTDPDLDNFVADNYPGVDSISGSGGGQLAVETTFVDASYFLGGVPSVFLLNFDTQLNLAFDQTDPSSCFWDGVVAINGVGPNTAAGTECAVNTVGAINGLSGPNEVLMSDSSTSFQSVPEPGSLALIALTLSILGLSNRRRKA